jgi:hypothetical protein
MLSYETHETTLHETHETALPWPLGALEKLFWFINQNRPNPLTFRRFGHAINTEEVFGTHTCAAHNVAP